jgi:hypothetical protein
MYRLIAVVALLSVAPPLAATVLVPAEFREVVAGSQVIVYGRVTGVEPEWTADRRRINSIVSLEVASYLKGGPGRIVTFRVPGGQVGRYKSVTVGAPEFRPGDEAVLFLTARGPAMAQVFGLNQGVFRVRVDARTGRRLVVPPALVAKGAGGEVLKRGSVDRRSMPLDAFAIQVRSALEQAQPGGAR